MLTPGRVDGIKFLRPENTAFSLRGLSRQQPLVSPMIQRTAVQSNSALRLQIVIAALLVCLVACLVGWLCVALCAFVVCNVASPLVKFPV